MTSEYPANTSAFATVADSTEIRMHGLISLRGRRWPRPVGRAYIVATVARYYDHVVRRRMVGGCSLDVRSGWAASRCLPVRDRVL